MDHKDLRNEIVEAIQRCCPTEIDIEKAKRSFYSVLVNDLIDEAQER